MTRLTSEQLVALQRFRDENGRMWKSTLLRLWERAAVQGELMQVRNIFGPAWLVAFRFGEADTHEELAS